MKRHSRFTAALLCIFFALTSACTLCVYADNEDNNPGEGQISYDDGGQSSYDDGGQTSYDDGGQSSYDDGGQSSYDDGGQTSYSGGGSGGGTYYDGD